MLCYGRVTFNNGYILFLYSFIWWRTCKLMTYPGSSSAAINTDIHTWQGHSFHLVYTQEWDCYHIWKFHFQDFFFLRNLQSVSPNVYANLYSPKQHIRVPLSPHSCQHVLFIFSLLKFCLFKRKSYKERRRDTEKDGERLAIFGFTPQSQKYGLGQSEVRIPGLYLGLSQRWQGHKYFVIISSFQSALEGSWIQSRIARTWSGTTTMDCGYLKQWLHVLHHNIHLNFYLFVNSYSN